MKKTLIILCISSLLFQCKRKNLDTLILEWKNPESKCEVASQLCSRKLLIGKDTSYVNQILGNPFYDMKSPPYTIPNKNGVIEFPYGRDSLLMYNYPIICYSGILGKKIFEDKKYYRIYFNSTGNVVHTYLDED